MGGKVKTNHDKGSVAPVPHKRKVRLLLWGGAYSTSDNFTFDWAVRNVTKDYREGDKNKYEIVSKKIGSADELIAIINGQEADSIRSIDLFTHGGPGNFYMVSVRSDTDGGLNKFRWYRYVFHNESFSRSDLQKLKWDRFADNAKVEFHGCKTAENPRDEDNIAADFSKRLYDAGKTKSAVIGHIINATPSINGEGKTDSKAQDYRHGPRAIFKNGKLTSQTSQKGAIDEGALEK